MGEIEAERRFLGPSKGESGMVEEDDKTNVSRAALSPFTKTTFWAYVCLRRPTLVRASLRPRIPTTPVPIDCPHASLRPARLHL